MTYSNRIKLRHNDLPTSGILPVFGCESLGRSPRPWKKKNLLGDGIAALEAWGEARSVPPAMNKMGQGAIF